MGVVDGSNKERSGSDGVEGMPIVAMGSEEGREAVVGMTAMGVDDNVVVKSGGRRGKSWVGRLGVG